MSLIHCDKFHLNCSAHQDRWCKQHWHFVPAANRSKGNIDGRRVMWFPAMWGADPLECGMHPWCLCLGGEVDVKLSASVLRGWRPDCGLSPRHPSSLSLWHRNRGPSQSHTIPEPTGSILDTQSYLKHSDVPEGTTGGCGEMNATLLLWSQSRRVRCFGFNLLLLTVWQLPAVRDERYVPSLSCAGTGSLPLVPAGRSPHSAERSQTTLCGESHVEINSHEQEQTARCVLCCADWRWMSAGFHQMSSESHVLLHCSTENSQRERRQ